MAVFWVQHYYTLPIIFEDLGMGNELPHRRQPQLTDDADDPQRVLPNSNLRTTQAMDFAPYPAQVLGQTQYENTPSPFNMTNMASALPDYQLRSYGQQPFRQQPFRQQLSPSPNSNLLHQMQQSGQFLGQNAPIFDATMQHYVMPGQQQQQQQQHGRGTGMQYSQFGGAHQFLQPSVQQAGLHSIHSQYQSQTQQFYQQPGHGNYGQSYAMRGGEGFQMGQMRLGSNSSAGLAFAGQQGLPRNLSRHSSDSSLQASVPRGPPRKPKQSGHALWVGNLPPGTQVIDLKDHFSRDATEDIESVFLISKSNCAFVNYKTESSCASAMSRFHDSRFQGVRLVCRLRRASTPSSANPPAAGSVDSQGKESRPSPGELGDVGGSSTGGEPGEPREGGEKVQEKYFIVKSLTVEDLELSARTGTWATQAHNEVTLNKAYQSAVNIYLIFSANKSGEYFGYARMASSIDDEQIQPSQQSQRPEVEQPSTSELPTAIPTPATATAPKGHIIDDSARGTIFWEADVEEEEGQKAEDAGNISGEGEDTSPVNPQTFGKPFRIEWLSTERLPFYRTRGLRNPWNSNREVKIARDGTELEPSVGRRLVSMFHRPQVPSLSPNSARTPQHLQQGYSRPY